jgi:rare lipoprotein A
MKHGWILGLAAAVALISWAAPPGQALAGDETTPDHSGRTQQGKASYYGPEFTGRKMANGQRLDPNSNAAASKTLPLGTTAKVTNLQNGKSTVVHVEDRGPYVKGRVVDVTPRAAEQLGIKKTGVAQVEVAPIKVPQPDGRMADGAGAARPQSLP